MDGLKRNDVVLYRGTYFVIAESDLLPPDLGIVTVPLLRDYPRVPGLNPTITFEDEPLILATRLIAALRRTSLEKVGDVHDQGDKITRAIDVLMSGV